jgi:uncharacterized YigZ family protein
MTLRDSYLTIARPTRSEIKIERSRFIATVRPAESRAAAEEEYRALQREFHDANHNCYAYIIGIEAETQFRYSDDGEPSGTAGKPIYESVSTRDLTNVLVVVTRYFGGIKLGTGGLGRAYREAANVALTEAGVLEKFIMQGFRLTFGHEQVSVVMKALAEYELKPLETAYSDQVELLSAIRLGRYDDFSATLLDRSHGRVTITKIPG